MHHVTELLENEGGIASTVQLQMRGARMVDISRALRAGSIERIRVGWVALPGAPAKVMRAVRVGGRLSCVSVLLEEKIWCAHDRRLHVRVAPGARGLSAPHDRAVPLGNPERWGVVIHRSHRAYGLDEPEGPVDSFEWSLLHAIGCQSKGDAIVTLDSALNNKRISRTALEFLMSELPSSYRRYLDLVDESAQSGLETKARLGLHRFNIPYRSQVEIGDAGFVDLLVGDRLVIELDGREFHSSDEAYEEDRRRDLILHELGYKVIRLTYDQVMDEWGRVVALIRELVGRQEHRWSAGHRRAGLGTTHDFG
ncbi:endonuclease domain-containing protein [Herbiconiux sp. YIM B11900]|uniref:endonuclease domain-containing protein n=1 Tax=Herbiconiux sp. YIM B11900 TaxID=3404131 RepID=UPI003F86AE31